MSPINFRAKQNVTINQKPEIKHNNVHQFNINKWAFHGKISKSIDALNIGAFKKTKFVKIVDHLPQVGDLILVQNTVKRVIGFNGALEKNSVETKSGELFYGNLYTAKKYAEKFASTKVNGNQAEGFVRAIVGHMLPEDHHHGEAWFEGNWRPLKKESIEQLGIEAIPLEKHYSKK